MGISKICIVRGVKKINPWCRLRRTGANKMQLKSSFCNDLVKQGGATNETIKSWLRNAFNIRIT